VLAALLGGLLLTGCGAVRAVVDTERQLTAAGYDTSLGYHVVNGVETVNVDWTPTASQAAALDIGSHDIARIVWQVAPVRFDVVEVTANGSETDGGYVARYPRAQLFQDFGPRPDGLDKTPSQLLNVRGFVIGAVVVFFVGLLVVALIVTLIVRAVKKSNRKRPPPPQWGPPPGQWGPGPQGQPAPWPGHPVHLAQREGPLPEWGAPPPPAPGPPPAWGTPPPAPPAAPGAADDPWAAPPR
jgi:hypothetical protein